MASNIGEMVTSTIQRYFIGPKDSTKLCLVRIGQKACSSLITYQSNFARLHKRSI